MGPSLVFLVCVFIGSLEANDCPPEEDMRPCTCSTVDRFGLTVECSSILSPEELIPPLDSLRSSKTRVDLKITDSLLWSLPDNLFKDTHIKKISFVKTQITYLAEYRTAFVGLENPLVNIEADDVDFVLGVDFDQFCNLKELNRLVFNRCKMHSEVLSLPYLPRLDYLSITRSEISFIANVAFMDLPNLNALIMQGNKISEVKRSMFPNPAKSLSFISLSDNMLSSLPKDFFENMPNLDNVFLRNNKFVTLSEKPFSDVLRNGRVWEFDMAGNPLHCDCKLSWLGSIRFPKYFDAKCATPESFSGKDIRLLDFESLRLQTCRSELLQPLLAFKFKRFPT